MKSLIVALGSGLLTVLILLCFEEVKIRGLFVNIVSIVISVAIALVSVIHYFGDDIPYHKMEKNQESSKVRFVEGVFQ
jgi:hypothetical protein